MCISDFFAFQFETCRRVKIWLRKFRDILKMLLPPCLPQQCGKDFRNSLKQPSPNYPYGYKTKKPRVVPAFTVQSMQKNTIVQPPPKCNIYEPLPPRPTMFRKCYKRGEFPVSIEFTLAGKRLSWKVIWDILLGTLCSGFSLDTMNPISGSPCYFYPKHFNNKVTFRKDFGILPTK